MVSRTLEFSPTLGLSSEPALRSSSLSLFFPASSWLTLLHTLGPSSTGAPSPPAFSGFTNDASSLSDYDDIGGNILSSRSDGYNYFAPTNEEAGAPRRSSPRTPYAAPARGRGVRGRGRGRGGATSRPPRPVRLVGPPFRSDRDVQIPALAPSTIPDFGHLYTDDPSFLGDLGGAISPLTEQDLGGKAFPAGLVPFKAVSKAEIEDLSKRNEARSKAFIALQLGVESETELEAVDRASLSTEKRAALEAYEVQLRADSEYEAKLHERAWGPLGVSKEEAPFFEPKKAGELAKESDVDYTRPERRDTLTIHLTEAMKKESSALTADFVERVRARNARQDQIYAKLYDPRSDRPFQLASAFQARADRIFHQNRIDSFQSRTKRLKMDHLPPSLRGPLYAKLQKQWEDDDLANQEKLVREGKGAVETIKGGYEGWFDRAALKTGADGALRPDGIPSDPRKAAREAAQLGLAWNGGYRGAEKEEMLRLVDAFLSMGGTSAKKATAPATANAESGAKLFAQMGGGGEKNPKKKAAAPKEKGAKKKA